MAVGLKRAYEPPAAGDGYRALVDRVWPRGLTKDALELDAWLKDLAPSAALRKWFGHDPKKWEEFRERYFRELDGQGPAIEELARRAREGRLTLVFAARDEKRNNAVALKDYLERRARE
jgi:uncharacterized protein YeaO (DUF488 family)